MNSWITLQSAERHCNKEAFVGFKMKEDVLLTWKITFLSSSNWIIMCRVSQFTFHAWYWVNQIFNSRYSG